MPKRRDTIVMNAVLRKVSCILALVTLTGLALKLRTYFFFFHHADWLYYFEGYIKAMQGRSGLETLKFRYGNTSPSFTLLLLLVSHSPFNVLFTLKTVYFAFEVFLALQCARITQLLGGAPMKGILIYGIVLFSPSVIVNGAMWGQADAVYTSFLVLAVYYVLRLGKGCQRPIDHIKVWLAFGVAISFKLQAVFATLVFGFYLIRSTVGWRYLPVVVLPYLIFSTPLLIAGRPLHDLISIYPRQTQVWPVLTSHSPTIFAILNDLPYVPYAKLALCVCLFTISALLLSIQRLKIRLGSHEVLRFAFLSTLLIPFLLTNMCERYFFPAEIFGIVFAAYNPKYSPLAALACGVSFLSYMPNLLPTHRVPLFYLGIGMLIVVSIFLVDTIFFLFKSRALDTMKESA